MHGDDDTERDDAGGVGLSLAAFVELCQPTISIGG